MSTATARSRAGYGLGAMGIAVVYQTLGAMLIYYLVRVLLIPPTQAGLIVFVSTLWDGIVDPIIAWAASKTRGKTGQYRPWLIFASVPVGAFFFLLFAIPDLNGIQLLTYVMAISLIFRSVFQACYLPYTALISRITSDPDERSRLAGYKGWFTSVGQVMVSLGGLSLIGWMGQGNDRLGFVWLGLVGGTVISLALLLAGLWSREEAVGADEEADTTNLITALRTMFRNPAFLRLLVASFTFGCAYSLLSNLTLFLFDYRYGGKGNARWALTAIAATGLIAAPFWSAIATRRDKRVVWISGATIAATGLLLLCLGNPVSPWIVIASYSFIGFGTQPLIIMQFAALADAIDFGEWKLGKRVNAFSFGTLTLVNKSALAIGGGGAGVLLALAGVSADQPPGAASIETLRLAMLLVPAAIFIVSAAVMLRFEVTTAVHRQALTEIRKRSGSKGLT